MCSKNEYTKSESNSQQTCGCWKAAPHCVQRTNIQNLKAIHNQPALIRLAVIIVFKERIYKIWKQFTTAKYNLKLEETLCSKNEYTKSESNSQQRAPERQWGANCVQRTNIQNLKAIHNNFSVKSNFNRIVFKERIYKIWKQFTTRFPYVSQRGWLCSKNEYTKSESNSQLESFEIWELSYCVQRTNIQNLKAIHNQDKNLWWKDSIVFKERIYKIWKQFTTSYVENFWISTLCSKNEYTKSESNSQLVAEWALLSLDCVQRTNIQNLKAIHNPSLSLSLAAEIVFKERIYKIWKQFTTVW